MSVSPVHSIVDSWLSKNRWLLERSRMLIGLVSVAAIWLTYQWSRDWMIAGTIAALALFVHLFTRWSDRYYTRRRDADLAEAIENLGAGSYVGLPTDDPISMALERSVGQLENRLLETIRDREAVLEEREAETDQLRASFEGLASERDEQNDAIGRLKAQIGELEERGVAERRKLTEEAETLRWVQATLDEKNKALQQELAEARRAASESDQDGEKQRVELEHTVSELEDRIRGLTTDHQAAREVWEAERARLEAADASARDLESRAQELETRRAELEAELKELKSAAASDEAARGEKERGLERELAALTQRFETESARFEDERGRFERERAQLQDEFQTALEKERVALEGKLDHSAEEQRKALEAERAKLESEREQQSAVERTNAELKARLQELKDALLQNEAEVLRLKEDGEQLRKVAESVGGDQLKFFDKVTGKLRGPVQISGKIAAELEEIGNRDEARHKIRDLRAYLSRMEHLVDQVVELCRLETNQWKTIFTEVDPRKLVQTRVAQFHEAAQTKSVKVNQELPVDLPKLTTDERLLSRGLTEILSNAVRVTPSGGRIDVSAGVIDDDKTGGRALKIQVNDTGVGLAADELQRVFLPFERAEKQPRFKEGESGAGLGLFLAKRYAELLGGRIEVESELKSGSRFSMITPLAATD